MNNIKTLYVVMESGGYSEEIEGIFSTKEIAEKRRKECNESKTAFFYHYYITEHILDYGQ